MRREIDENLLSSLSLDLQESTQKDWITYLCELVTPMYGGGVIAGKIDVNMPIRASAIRGHLRFWWRIACGPKDAQNLFEQEKVIWGGIGDDGAKASQVKIRVRCNPINANQLESSRSITGSGVRYILGAAEATECLRSSYQFDLEIGYRNETSDDIRKQVQEALRWWSSFGGLGGRTRRGFGAINIRGLEPVPITAVEHKGGKLVFRAGIFDSAEQAWYSVAQQLYLFRQGKEVGRNKGEEKRPGRSRWPEPDQLRRITNKYKTNHKPEHRAGNVFPRAAFGLPIIFDFNDRTGKEPNTMTLLPKGSQRMASPLIIQSYEEEGRWRAAALLLPKWEDTLVEQLELSPSVDDVKPQSWPRADQQTERNNLTEVIPPMRGRANDPLSAFLDFFEKGI